MANTIQIKRKTNAGAPSSLADGELALNTTDDKLYIGNSGVSEIDYLNKAGGDLTGDLTLWGNFGANSTSALSTWTGRLKFDTDFSNIARGPNKVEIYN